MSSILFNDSNADFKPRCIMVKMKPIVPIPSIHFIISSWIELNWGYHLMGNSIWIPHTPCGRFKEHLPQGELVFQVDKLIWHLWIKYLLPLWWTWSKNHTEGRYIWKFTLPCGTLLQNLPQGECGFWME